MRFYLVAPLVALITIYYSITSIIVALLDKSGHRYHRILRRWSRALLWLFGVRTTIRGVEHIDRSRNYVYLANHSSYLDIIALGATIPDEIRFVFKRELARIPLFGWTLALGPYILMDRTDPRNAMASIEVAAKQIREGASVAIFPEGTRTSDGHLAPFKRGGFLLALKSGVPMVPVAIKGTYQLLNRNDRKVRPGHVEIVIGTPISYEQELTRPEETALQNRIHEELRLMLDNTPTNADSL
jgi:1-acyl-sn-glycerol-3-phosphate acyltransferase